MGKPYQSPGRKKNSSYYIAKGGDRTHDLPHNVASNMVKVSHARNHSATVKPQGKESGQRNATKSHGRQSGIYQTPGYIEHQHFHMREDTWTIPVYCQL